MPSRADEPADEVDKIDADADLMDHVVVYSTYTLVSALHSLCCSKCTRLALRRCLHHHDYPDSQSILHCSKE
jgi:hypothetical protein